MRILKTHPILGLVNSYTVDSPQPSNLSYIWNFGSLLGLCLVIQIITGVTLAIHYTPSIDIAFNSVEHIIRSVNYGWLIRYIHANVASFFFIFVYIHIGRGLYYASFRSPRTLVWSIGVIILVLMIATAFLGYVLPYGQMSLWGIFLCLTCFNIIISLYSFIDKIIIYLKVNHVNKRILGKYRIGPHNKDIISIFYGIILSSTNIIEQNINSTRIALYQEAWHSEYLLYLHRLIADLGYCNPISPKIQTRLSNKGIMQYVIRFHTYSYTSLNVIYDNWYNNGIKQVPINIEIYLSPLALALWIINDGIRKNNGLKLNTKIFTFKDCTRLTILLYDIYNIKSSVQSLSNENYIYVWSESIPSLRELVRPYIVSSILYKMGS